MPHSPSLVCPRLYLIKQNTDILIDPAYPPSRQTIYLRVAQPRGLVVLKGAGTISPSVREFISTELQVRVEVPALELLANGEIVGGSGPDGSDVLTKQVSLADQDPAIVLGPDSVGTLSFTSGSTGIPKGVKGRHYSLTHFFPWMGERFGLGEHSKFTMLSGIAHDPIQRDSEYEPTHAERVISDLNDFQCSRLFSSVRNCTSPPPTISVPPED